MVETGKSDPIECNILLDTASSSSFIARSKVRDIVSTIKDRDKGLRVLERKVPLHIKMLNDEKQMEADLIRLRLVKAGGGCPVYLNAYVLDNM